MKLIVAVDKNWAIGNNGDLLYRFPEDMRFFKEITTNAGIVIMGRKTYESLNCIPLKNRINWVLSRDKDFAKTHSEIKVFDSLDEIMRNIRDPYSGNFITDPNNICVIGGREIYNLFLPFVNEAYVTKIMSSKSEVDTYFPINLDEDSKWKLVESTPGKDCERIGTLYSFNRYERK